MITFTYTQWRRLGTSLLVISILCVLFLAIIIRQDKHIQTITLNNQTIEKSLHCLCYMSTPESKYSYWERVDKPTY